MPALQRILTFLHRKSNVPETIFTLLPNETIYTSTKSINFRSNSTTLLQIKFFTLQPKEIINTTTKSTNFWSESIVLLQINVPLINILRINITLMYILQIYFLQKNNSLRVRRTVRAIALTRE